MSSSSHGDKPVNKVEEFKNKLKDLQIKETVAVPKMKSAEDNGTNNSIRVLKVNFAKYFSDKQKSIPHPFLLAMRAAITWSSLQETKLLPACTCASITEDETAHSILSIKEIICTLTYDDDDSSVLRKEKPSASATMKSLCRIRTRHHIAWQESSCTAE